MEKMKMPYEMMLGLFAELWLDESVRLFKQEKLYEQIDLALAIGDESAFFALTNELKQLLR